jgi:hypothetical protein
MPDIGTFFLVATIGFTVLKPDDAGPLAPLKLGRFSRRNRETSA